MKETGRNHLKRIKGGIILDQIFDLSPIGTIHNDQNGFYLQLKPEFKPALAGLEDFNHLNVLWWAHLADSEEQRANLQVQKPYQNGPMRLGIFATRSPQRPNPIGLTVAQILHIDHNAGTIYLPYIDTENGTPVIDIKPYHPSTDRVRDAEVPDWCSNWPACYEDSADFDWESVFAS